MLPLVPCGLMLRKSIGPLPERFLLRAHAEAPRLLAGLQGVEPRFWASQGLQSLVATAIALIGHLAFGWSALWVLAALAVDLASTAIGDWLKLRMAPSGVAAEMGQALEAEFVLDVARAMDKVTRWPGPPGPPRPATRDTAYAHRYAKSGPLRHVFHGTDPRQDTLAATGRVLRELSILVVPICALVVMLAAVDANRPDPLTLLLLAAAAAMRLVEAVHQARAAERRAGEAHPQLLPASLPPAAALYLSSVVLMILVVMVVPGLGGRAEQVILDAAGSLLLGLHVLFTLVLLGLWRRRVRQARAELAAFAGQDVRTLRERWLRANGGDPALCLAGGRAQASPTPASRPG